MERHRVPAIDPFPANLRSPKEDTIVGAVASDEPDPFDANERDRILEWYRLNKPYWYAFLSSSSGRAAALPRRPRSAKQTSTSGKARCGSIRVVMKVRSNEPKTRGSKRMIKLYPNVVDVLVKSRAAPPPEAG
jgi:hypothetical protein